MSENLIIKNSNNLSGKIFVSGAKNSVLPIMAASLLTREEVVLFNVPKITDVDVMCNILKSIGSKIKREKDTLIIDNSNLMQAEVNFDEMKKIRASSLLLGPMIARTGYFRMPFPGGCKIGKRPIDLHLDGLRKLGVNVYVEKDTVKSIGILKPGVVRLEFPSVGATENLIMASVFSKGYTKIENAAKEPEIVDLGRFLNLLGAKIYGCGTDTIIIEGVRKLYSGMYTPMPDRIEAGTYMLGVCGVKSDVLFENINPRHLKAVIVKLNQMGAKVITNYNTLRIKSDGKVKGSKVICMPYPGFPTDLQAPMCTLMCVAKGQSYIEEKVFNNRFHHVDQLKKMGAKIKVMGNVASIQWVDYLVGTKVKAQELRGGGALMMAGVIAKGQTVLSGTNYIKRGYGQIVEKLQNIGIDINWE